MIGIEKVAELYGIMSHPGETDDELRARIRHKIDYKGPSPASSEYYRQLHAEMKGRVPAALLFGPLMVRGPDHEFSDFMTETAFQLLREAGWKLVSSEWD